MAYSIQQGQTCTICLADDSGDLVGKFEKTSLYSETPIEIIKGKILKCTHAFHEQCINTYIYHNGNNCPNCRAPIEDKDRKYGITEDPSPPKKNYRYFFNQDNDYLTYLKGKTTYIFDTGVSQHVRDYILNNPQVIDNLYKNTKPDISLTISPDNIITQDNQSQGSFVWYIDKEGNSHSGL